MNMISLISGVLKVYTLMPMMQTVIHRPSTQIVIKTHGSESRGQEEAAVCDE